MQLPVPMVEFILVNYPFRVINEANAFRTLGGLSNVTEIIFDNVQKNEKRKLPLYFRPDNAYAKPLMGEEVERKGVVVNFKQFKSRSTGEVRIIFEILGYFKRVYEYDRLVDYQYNPHENASLTNPKVIYNQIIPKGPILDSSQFDKYLSSNSTLFLPPIVFDRFRKPADLNYYKSQTKTVSLPDRSLAQNIDYSSSQYQTLNKLFQDKPVWTKHSLKEHVSKITLHQYLHHFAVFECKGCWARGWIRNDYDYKSDQSSRFYQILDFRPNIKFINIFKDFFDKNNKKEESERSPITASSVKVGPNHLPMSMGCFYQLCDIEVPSVVDLLAKEPVAKKYNANSGWFADNFYDRCRKLIDIFLHQKVMELSYEDMPVLMDIDT